ncbi:hypothetical protein B7494_g2867 [Chlorociboria aeruginascens]|nr:hypothetical protein B7494_g2867 [Chlorociboria aeruginascens]
MANPRRVIIRAWVTDIPADPQERVYCLGRDVCQQILYRPFNNNLQDKCHDAMHFLPNFDSENNVKAWFIYDFNVTGPLSKAAVLTIPHEVYQATRKEDTWAADSWSDQLVSGSDGEKLFLSLARNEQVEFALGWHVVRNLDSGDKEQDRNVVEALFLAESNFRTLPGASLGIAHLRQRLSTVLFGQIKAELPQCLRRVLIRFPLPGKVYEPWRVKKVKNEVMIMNYLSEYTSIPVPRVYHWGLTGESPQQLGPFMIEEFMQGENLGDILRNPTRNEPDPAILDPDIDEAMLDIVYEQIAGFMLELSRLEFPRIGAISQDTVSGEWTVAEPPLAYDMNEVPFASSSDYFAAHARNAYRHISRRSAT